MRKIIIFLLLTWTTLWAVAQESDTSWRGIDNTFLFERYAPRQELVVAQIVHYPIGDSIFVNLVMLQAQDSTSFQQLMKEFGFKTHEMLKPFSGKHNFTSNLSDRYDPTKQATMLPNGTVDLSKACWVIAYPDHLTMWIAHFKNEDEYRRLILLPIKHITDGKQFLPTNPIFSPQN